MNCGLNWADADRESIPHRPGYRDPPHDVITAYHRIQLAKSVEKISHKDEGYLFATALQLAGLVLWLSTFGYLFFPAYFQWSAMPLPTWQRWTGVAIGALCSPLMYWTLSSLGNNLNDTVVT